MKRTTRFSFIIIGCALLSGCESDSSEIKNIDTPVNIVIENSTPQPTTIIHETHQTVSDWKTVYPEVAEFVQTEEWERITLISEGGGYYRAKTLPIEDPILKKLIGDTLRSITGEVGGDFNAFGNPYFLLENGNKQSKIYVGMKSHIAFLELYGTRLFGTDPNIVPIVDALLPRPEYVPDATFEERLWDGGLLYYQEGRYRFILQDRERKVAELFFRFDKEIIKDPQINIDDADYLYRLFTHGGTIEFHVFREQGIICVLDNGEASWFRMSNEFIIQFDYIVRAS